MHHIGLGHGAVDRKAVAPAQLVVGVAAAAVRACFQIGGGQGRGGGGVDFQALQRSERAFQCATVLQSQQARADRGGVGVFGAGVQGGLGLQLQIAPVNVFGTERAAVELDTALQQANHVPGDGTQTQPHPE